MHTPTQAGGRRSTEVRGGSLRRWLLALGVIAGLLLSHVLNDHDVAPDHDSTVAGPVIVFGTAASVVYGLVLWLVQSL